MTRSRRRKVFEEGTGYCRKCRTTVTATRARVDKDEVRDAMIIGGFIGFILGLFFATFSIVRPWRCSQCQGRVADVSRTA